MRSGALDMSSKQEPLVSVVTPVYNGEQYLRECIESVLAQTYANWDYTIVNNCSTDRTLEIAREYASRDSRIRIHSNETFVRVIENHNIAFRQISPQSKYCKVVASDDWIFPECLEKMVRLAEEHPSVAIVGSYGLCGTEVVHNGLPYTSTVIPGRELCRRHHMGEMYVFGAPTSVLFRSDIVRKRHTFYNENNFHADTEACYEFLEHNDFGFVHQVLTFRREREESLTSYSEKLNTYLPNILYILTRYGPKYLSEEEFAYELRKKLRVYYRFLGREAFRMRGSEFWSFHRKKLAAAGYPLSYVRLSACATAHALDLLLNPKRTAEAAWSRIRGIFTR
jgi:glycosyltransferase involved in cell wall biosynthesis